MKPEASDQIRGEFSRISTRTPGLKICEHLPMLVARSDRWAFVRSLTHPYKEHFEGHIAMLSGRTPIPRGTTVWAVTDRGRASENDWPTPRPANSKRFSAGTKTGSDGSTFGRPARSSLR
jgi:hypothetical protein